MATNWQMKEVSKSCTMCGKEFSDGQQYHSLLEISHNDLLCTNATRNDYCIHCWKELPEQKAGKTEEPLDSYSWKGVFRTKEKKDSSNFKRGRLETMLAYMKDNIGNPDRKVSNLLFALAVILERKKILVPCESSAYNPTMLVYKHSKSDDTFILKTPENIDEDKEFINISIQELSASADEV